MKTKLRLWRSKMKWIDEKDNAAHLYVFLVLRIWMWHRDYGKRVKAGKGRLQCIVTWTNISRGAVRHDSVVGTVCARSSSLADRGYSVAAGWRQWCKSGRRYYSLCTGGTLSKPSRARAAWCVSCCVVLNRVL